MVKACGNVFPWPTGSKLDPVKKPRHPAQLNEAHVSISIKNLCSKREASPAETKRCVMHGVISNSILMNNTVGARSPRASRRLKTSPQHIRLIKLEINCARYFRKNKQWTPVKWSCPEALLLAASITINVPAIKVFSLFFKSHQHRCWIIKMVCGDPQSTVVHTYFVFFT